MRQPLFRRWLQVVVEYLQSLTLGTCLWRWKLPLGGVDENAVGAEDAPDLAEERHQVSKRTLS